MSSAGRQNSSRTSSPARTFSFKATAAKAGGNAKRPVLVLGCIPRIVVTIARSLKAQGIAVDVASFSSSPALASGAIRDFRRLAHPALNPDEFLAELKTLLRQGGHDMLIPADDQALTAVTLYYQDLDDLTYIACPPPEITGMVLDKRSSLAIADGRGLRIPKTKLISNSAQLSELISECPFPWVLKPARKELQIEEVKSLIIMTPGDISAKFPSPRDFTPPMLVQEYCPGAGVGVEILLHDEECVAAFQHRRLQETPYTGGVSVMAVAERPDPVLVAQSLDVLRELRWEGPAMVEFKINSENGAAVFMEVNGRYWGTIALPVAAGLDFPRYHWQIVHGEEPDIPDGYTIGTKWRWTAGQIERLHSLLVDSRRSRPARRELLSSLSHLPGQFSDSTCDPLFSSSDPMPALLESLRVIRYHSLDDTRAIAKKLLFRSKVAERSPSPVRESA